MQSIIRATRLSAQTIRPVPALTRTSRHYASSSYGNSQSGHQKAEDAPNPKEHLEHPGAEAPADKGTAQSSSQSQSSGSQGTSSSSSDAKPAIHQPGPPPENSDAEVEAHNKDLENRNDRTVNQIEEGDVPVNKKFWKGDVGPKTGEKKG